MHSGERKKEIIIDIKVINVADNLIKEQFQHFFQPKSPGTP